MVKLALAASSSPIDANSLPRPSRVSWSSGAASAAAANSSRASSNRPSCRSVMPRSQQRLACMRACRALTKITSTHRCPEWGSSQRLEVRAAAFEVTRGGEGDVAGEQRAIAVRWLASAAVASIVPDDERIVDEETIRLHHIGLVPKARLGGQAQDWEARLRVGGEAQGCVSGSGLELRLRVGG
eukprot:scaffold39525_cov55-Phaeocystis_antarctica.AAC.4